jgi:hypothetical protein
MSLAAAFPGDQAVAGSPWQEPRSGLAAAVHAMPLIDHHLHSVFGADLSDEDFECSLTEASAPLSPPARPFDSQLGFAVRRWCAPVLDLPPFSRPADYLARRRELGAHEVNRRLLVAANTSDLLVDGGYAASALLPDDALAEASAARVRRIVRLEAVAEKVVGTDAPSTELLDALDEALRQAAVGAIGFKSIAAYRCGLSLAPEPPSPTEVHAALVGWSLEARNSGTARLVDPVIIRHLIWWALRDGRPLQFHVGFGDADVSLRDADPLLLQDLIARSAPTATAIMLLHCYPFHRAAGFLASVYPHVFLDVGLAANYVGGAATAVVSESMELAPFGKILYSSDAYGPAELVYTGAMQWRNATVAVLDRYLKEGGWPLDECVRIATMIGRTNAESVYRLTDGRLP